MAGSEGAPTAGSEEEAEPAAADISPVERELLQKEGPTTAVDLDDSGKDFNAIPMEVNRMVLQWIDYFQGRGREHMERYLGRSTRYLPTMKAILRQNGLPEDLVYIALIESGFSPNAHSSANAVGYWQFIRATGKRYGLQIDAYVDERRDFIKSTQAAADYYKGLYNLFGSWFLAIASYNVGENRVKNMVMKYHTRDFWALAKDKRLPRETIDYIPKFMAARMIGKEPEKYGFTNIEWEPPLEFSEVELTHSVDLRKMAEAMGIDYDDLKALNPMYKRGVAFDKGGRLALRVPVGTQEKAMVAAAASQISSRAMVAVADDDDITYYKVKRGETIGSIARKFQTTTKRLRALNRLSSSAKIVAGRRIKVPNDSLAGLGRHELVKASNQRKTSRGVASKKSARESGPKVHIVRRGESLLQIARLYEISLSELASLNKISRRSKIPVGARLQIPD